jgi:ribosomal protein S18 acetylase RimI-like enzyme
MNDLYVAPAARGRGIGAKLIEACSEECAQHGAIALEWYTKPSNQRAQAVYDRTGASREEWISYSLSVS